MQMLNDSTLAVRWKFSGIKRITLAELLLMETNAERSKNRSSSKEKVVEGISYYKFNDDGFIDEHVLDQIEPPLQRWSALKAWFWWIGRLPDTSFQHQYKRNVQ